MSEYEGNGLGRALLTYLLKDVQAPIFLHTHPTLFRAIALYGSFGFKFVKSEFIGYRSNDLDECFEFIRSGMGKRFYNIEKVAPKKQLLSASLSSIELEF